MFGSVKHSECASHLWKTKGTEIAYNVDQKHSEEEDRLFIDIPFDGFSSVRIKFTFRKSEGEVDTDAREPVERDIDEESIFFFAMFLVNIVCKIGRAHV